MANTPTAAWPQWLTVKQACEYLHVSRGTLRLWRLQRRLRVSKVGRMVRIKRGDLDRVMEAVACK